MAHIILTWNFHLTESPVDEELAKKLESDLIKRGHTVDIKEIPKGTPTKPVNPWAVINDLLNSNPDSFVFDLHSSPRKKEFYIKEHQFQNALKPKKSKARLDPTRWKEQLEVRSSYPYGYHMVVNAPNRFFVVEIPAIGKEISKGIEQFRGTERLPYRGGYTKEADLKASNEANFLSPLVIRKLGHLIDTTVNTQLGIYRKPRGDPFLRKGAKKVARAYDRKQHRVPK